MAKLKIISSYSLKCLQERLQVKITESHTMIELLRKEIEALQNRDHLQSELQTVRRDLAARQARLETLREALVDISYFVSEIDI